MAHRIITQVIITGSRVVGRAFAEAYRQANASSQYAKQAGGNGAAGASRDYASSGLTLDEACRILNVVPPKNGKTDMENVISRFKRLFDQNNPEKGGSFYLQSKILRARERIELEMREAEEREALAKGTDSWRPKIYKDR